MPATRARRGREARDWSGRGAWRMADHPGRGWRAPCCCGCRRRRSVRLASARRRAGQRAASLTPQATRTSVAKPSDHSVVCTFNCACLAAARIARNRPLAPGKPCVSRGPGPPDGAPADRAAAAATAVTTPAAPAASGRPRAAASSYRWHSGFPEFGQHGDRRPATAAPRPPGRGAESSPPDVGDEAPHDSTATPTGTRRGAAPDADVAGLRRATVAGRRRQPAQPLPWPCPHAVARLASRGPKQPATTGVAQRTATSAAATFAPRPCGQGVHVRRLCGRASTSVPAAGALPSYRPLRRAVDLADRRTRDRPDS